MAKPLNQVFKNDQNYHTILRWLQKNSVKWKSSQTVVGSSKKWPKIESSLDHGMIFGKVANDLKNINTIAWSSGTSPKIG